MVRLSSVCEWGREEVTVRKSKKTGKGESLNHRHPWGKPRRNQHSDLTIVSTPNLQAYWMMLMLFQVLRKSKMFNFSCAPVSSTNTFIFKREDKEKRAWQDGPSNRLDSIHKFILLISLMTCEGQTLENYCLFLSV